MGLSKAVARSDSSCSSSLASLRSTTARSRSTRPDSGSQPPYVSGCWNAFSTMQLYGVIKYSSPEMSCAPSSLSEMSRGACRLVSTRRCHSAPQGKRQACGKCPALKATRSAPGGGPASASASSSSEDSTNSESRTVSSTAGRCNTKDRKLYLSSQLSWFHVMSFSEKNEDRAKTALCCWRMEMMSRLKRKSPDSSAAQASHENQFSESWHQELLLPLCDRPYSSPERSMGVPAERKSATRRFRI
mmetsp:Transcript_89384/g.208088  ORF Transcript_89384/g.208088 Transcript_89384/m.208088 type:complete len:245 (-) Transcript_89384:1626-2360(-)